MFEIETKREETAYRMGYRDGWQMACNEILKMIIQGFTPGRIRRKVKGHWNRALLPWSQDKSPEIDEPAPGLSI